MDRRTFLKTISGLLLSSATWTQQSLAQSKPGILVNDVHTGLNPTRVREIMTAHTSVDIQNALEKAAHQSLDICITGGRHAAGGQQFCTDSLLLDTQHLNRILAFDPDQGQIEVEAGIRWTDIMHYLNRLQAEESFQWSIKQKPTGSDSITLGGSIGANNHGRVLTSPPLISDVESLRLINADGQICTCSRTENPELFKLVLGGYGLFGVVYSVTLRLVQRQKLRRNIQAMSIAEVYPAYLDAVQNGCTYGAFDFSFDPLSAGYLRDGFLLTYQPVPPETPVSPQDADFSFEKWMVLTELIHRDKTLTYEKYKHFYESTAGEVFWNDTAQLGPYKDYYHLAVDERLGLRTPSTETITEVYVPKTRLAEFFKTVRADFTRHHVDFIYGTVRFIQEDTESFLPWARGDFACVIFNIHIQKTPNDIAKAQGIMCRLIDRAIEQGGSYYLTYHRYARKDQVLACYPEFPAFLKHKRDYDPRERFQSTWYQHYRKMFRENS